MATPKPKFGYNPDPRLSANQLAEYINASPPRRKSIIQAAKFPKTIVVARYDIARTALSKYLADVARKQSILVDAINDLKIREAKPTAKEWTKNDSQLSIEAIEAFQKAYNKTGLSKLECRSIAGKQPKLEVAGVEVSVALDATVHRSEPAGPKYVGGVILLFAKSETSATQRQERSKTSAVLSYLICAQNLGYLGEVDKKLCFAHDVFAGAIHICPNSFVRRLDSIEAACEEVALRWPVTFPPIDYDGPSDW